MNQPAILDQDIRHQDIRALQEWLRAAWQQLGDPSLTAFARRELRNQMKQCNADLRSHLQKVAQSRPPTLSDSALTIRKPELLRILA
jgi:hypothetical protein